LRCEDLVTCVGGTAVAREKEIIREFSYDDPAHELFPVLRMAHVIREWRDWHFIFTNDRDITPLITNSSAV
jgi:hypothetical protein